MSFKWPASITSLQIGESDDGQVGVPLLAVCDGNTKWYRIVKAEPRSYFWCTHAEPIEQEEENLATTGQAGQASTTEKEEE